MLGPRGTTLVQVLARPPGGWLPVGVRANSEETLQWVNSYGGLTFSDTSTCEHLQGRGVQVQPPQQYSPCLEHRAGIRDQ